MVLCMVLSNSVYTFASQKEEKISELDYGKVLNYVDNDLFLKKDYVLRIPAAEELNSYVFENQDGTRDVYILDENVKYIRDGEIVEKDISLVEKETYFTTKENDISLKFYKNLADGIYLEYLDEKIVMQPMAVEMEGYEAVDNSVIYNTNSANIVYKYTPTLIGVKEEIILSHYTEMDYKFILKTNGLSLYEDENGKYFAISELAKEKYYLSEVIMYDAAGDARKGEIGIIEVEAGNEYIIQIIPDYGFLRAPTTVYPVTIDPSISVSDNTHGINSIVDAPIFSGLPDLNFGTYQYNRLGKPSDYYGIGRTVVKLVGLANSNVFRNLSSSSRIISSKFYVTESSGISSQTIDVFPIVNNWTWTETNVTWNNIGTWSSTSYATSTLNSNQTAEFDITSLTRAWKNQNYLVNAGFIMINRNEAYNESFFSSEYTGTYYRPYVVMTYDDTSTRTIADGVYFIMNKNSEKYMQVSNGSTANGTSIVQGSYDGALYQRFKVKYESDGFYTIKPMNVDGQQSAIDLVSQTAANTNGTAAQIWSYATSFSEQKFTIEGAIGGGYQIGTKMSNGNKVLEVQNSSEEDGAVIQIWDYSDTRNNDNWYFEPVNFGSAPAYSDIRCGGGYEINCAGFALRIKKYLQLNIDRPQDATDWPDIYTVANATVSRFNDENTGRTIRLITNYNTPTFPIASNEYRVALRITTSQRIAPRFDYHFYIQLDDGSWAHKQGSQASATLGYINPSTSTWLNYYDSEVVYFAVSY